MSFSDVFALPFTRTVNGKPYTVKLLTTSDYLPWLSELKDKLKAEFKAGIPHDTTTIDQFTANKAIALYDVTPDSLIPLIGNGVDTIRVLKMLGRKAGITDDTELNAFVDGGSLRQNLRDAYRGSSLLSAEDYLAYFPDELPVDDTRIVLARLARMSPKSREEFALALTDPSTQPNQKFSAMVAIVGVPETSADPNAQSPADKAAA